MPKREMPTFAKSPAELVARFGEVLDRHPEAERRQMFGYPAAFVGGNMATGLFADKWMVRLPEDAIPSAKASGATDFEPMPGRPMKSFVVIPERDVADDTKIVEWVARGLAHAASLPAKASKRRAK
jgi:TfoX/Sxy family transcriptional regulator of competence genes